ncbi:unnamed protein product, partial [Heterotrigona itama]
KGKSSSTTTPTSVSVEQAAVEEDAEADGGDDRQRDRGLESEPVALLPFVSPSFKHAALHTQNCVEICVL